MPGDSGKGCAAIVTTLRGAGAVLDSFIDYHLAIGFAHLFLFFDDPGDPDLSRAAANPAVTAIAHDESLRRAWTRLPQYEEQAAFLEREVMARQILNVQLAMEMARRQGLGWLLNIDADELFYSPGQSAGEYFAALADALRGGRVGVHGRRCAAPRPSCAATPPAASRAGLRRAQALDDAQEGGLNHFTSSMTSAHASAWAKAFSGMV